MVLHFVIGLVKWSFIMSPSTKYSREHKKLGLCAQCKTKVWRHGAARCWIHTIQNREIKRKSTNAKRRNRSSATYEATISL